MYKHVTVLQHKIQDVFLRIDVLKSRWNMTMPECAKYLLRNPQESDLSQKELWKITKTADVKLNLVKFVKDVRNAVKKLRNL